MPRRIITAVVFAAFLAVGLFNGAVAQSGMQAGSIRVVKVEGRAWQVSASGQQEALREGALIRDGSSIDTTSSGTVVLLFENGSTIEIKPGTKFIISEFLRDPFDSSKVDYRGIKAEPSKSVTRVSVPEGSIIAKVRPLRPGSDFSVGTPLGTAGIRGTTFFVESSSGNVSVGVAEGAVQFTTSQGGTQSITAGKSIGVSPGGQFGAPSANAGALMDAAQEAAAAVPPSVPSGPGTFPGDTPAEDSAPAPDSGSDLAAAQDQALQAAAAQGEQALLQTAAQLASDSPEQAAAIAARAAQLMPSAAPQIAATVASAVPAQANNIAQSVSQVVPGSAPAIAAAIISAVPTANPAAVQAAANTGASIADTGGGGGGGAGGPGVALPSGGGGGGSGGSASANPAPTPVPGPTPGPTPARTPPNYSSGTVTITPANESETTLNGVVGTVSGTAVVNVNAPGVTVQSQNSGSVNVNAANTTLQSLNGGGLNVAGSGTKVNSLSGGNITVASGGLEIVELAQGGQASALAVNGGLLNLGSNVVPVAGPLNLTGGQISNGSVNATTYNVSGGSADAVLAGNGSLNKTGSGTVTLTGANTYSGGTTVSGGTLAGNATSLQGPITNNANVAFNQTTLGTYAGAMSGTGTLTKTGDSTLTLSGANTYAGGTTVSGGTLAGNATSLQGPITNNANVAFNQTASGTYVGAMSGTGTLTKTGNETLTLTGANTYAGGTTVSGGSLVGFAGSDAEPGSLQGNISVASGTTAIFRQTLKEDGFAGNYNGVVSGAGALRFEESGTVNISQAQTVSGNTFIGSNATVSLTGSGRLSSSSDLSIEGGLLGLGGNTQSIKSLSLNGGAVDNGTLASIGALNLQAGTINASISLALELNKTGPGEVVLGGANTFSGATSVSGGTLKLTSEAALSPNSDVAVSGSTTVVDLGGLAASAKSITLSAGQINNGKLTANSYVLEGGALNASLAGAGTLTKNGSGTVTLAGDNVLFTGTATITAGTILLTDDDALSGTSSVTVGSGATLDIGAMAPALNVLNMNGGTLTTAPGSDGLLELTTVNVTAASTLNARLSANSLLINTSGSVTIGRDNVLAQVSSVTLEGNGTLNIGAFNQNLSAGTVTLTSGTISGSGTLTAGTFNLASGTVEVNLAGNGAMNVTGAVALNGASYTAFTGNVSVKSSGNLTGSLTSLGGNLEVLGGGTAAFSGAGTFGGVISGAGTVNKSGAGSLTLTGNSSGFTGDFNVQAGSVSGAPANLPAKLAVSSGATLSFSSGGTYAGALSGAGTVNAANGTSLVLSNFTGHTGSFNVAGASVDLAGAGIYAGQFSGAGTLTKSGSGALNLTGDNSGFTGTTAVNEGELSLGNADALRGNVTVANGATLNTTVNVNLGTSAQVTLNGGTIGGSAELAAGTFNVQSGTVSTFIAGNELNKTGSGVLTVTTEDALANVVNTTVGGNGTLDVGSHDQNLGLANSTLMVLEQGKVVSGSTRGASTITVDTFNAQEGEITVNLVTTLVKNGAGTVDLKGTSYVLQDNLVINDTGTLRLFETPQGTNPLSFADPASTVGGTGTFNVVLLGQQQVQAAPQSIRTAAIVPQSTGFNFNFNFTGNVNVVIEGSGTTTLGGTNNSTGTVTVAGGTVVLDSGGSSAIGGGGLNVTGGTLDITDTALNAGVVLNGGTITSSTGSGSINATNLTVVSGTLNVGLTGNYRLVKDDPGVLVLSQVNTYTGGTEINAGTLVITQTGALPGYNVLGQVDINSGAALAVGNAVSDAAVADILATGNLKSGSSFGFDTTGGSRTYGTAITGSIGLVKVGTGDLTLTAANTFTGNVGIQGGALILGDANAIPSGGNVSLTGGTLNVGAFAPSLGAITAESGSLAGAGTVTATSFTKTGTGSFVIAGNLTGPATINVNGGTLQIGNGGTTGSVGANISTVAGSTLVFNLSSSPTFNNAISGAGSVEQSGSGSVTLSGANTSFTGNVLVSSGTLALGNNGALGSAAVTVANSGTLSVNNGINAATSAPLILNGGTISGAGTLSTGSFELNGGTIAASLAGSGAMTVNGAVSLNAANTSYSGVTTVNSGGALALGNNGALGTSAVTVAIGGTLNVGSGINATSGVLTLDGGSLAGDGTLSAASYTLLSGTVNAKLAGSGAMTVNGTVSLNAANASYSGATTVNGGGTLNLGNNGALGTSAVTVASNGTLSVGPGVNATSGVLTLNGGTVLGEGTLSAASYTLNSGRIAAALTGSGAMAVNGAVTLTAANSSYTGTATVNGTLTLGNAGAVAAATVTVSPTGTLNVGSFNAGVAILNLNGGSLLGSSVGSLSGTGLFNLTAGNVNVGLAGPAAVQVNGAIAFNRPNTYTGLTTINSSGVLNLNVRNAITGAVSVNGGTLDVGANPQTLGAVTMNGGTINGASTITSTGGFNFANGTVNAPIGGAVGVNITGGTVNLNGLNVYTGVTTVSSGAILVGNVTSISGSSIVNSGTVEFAQTDNRLYGGAVSGSGSLVKSGAGTLTLLGTNSYSGGTLVSAGGLVGTTTSLRGNITNNAAVSFNQSGNGSFTNLMTGSGSLTKLGGGAVTLSGSNAYTGPTLVGGGSLFVEGNQAAATGAVTVQVGATLGGKGTIGGATTIAGIHRMGASQTGSAPGIQTFSQSLTYQAGAQAFWRLTDNTTNIGTPGNYSYDRTVVGTSLNVANAPSVTFNLSFNTPGSLVDWSNSFWSFERRGTSGWLVYDATTLNINGIPNLNDPSLWTDASAGGGKTLSSTRPDYTFVFFRDDAQGDLYLNYIYSP